MYYIVQANYGYGWDSLTYTEDWKEAKRDLEDYRKNEPQYPHRIKNARKLELYF